MKKIFEKIEKKGALEKKQEEESSPQLAHERREKIILLKQKGSLAFLEIGRELHFIEELEEYKILGFESMRAYLAAPEASGGLDITRSWLEQFKLNYEKFILELGYSNNQIASLEPSKLIIIKNIVNKENADKWLEKVKTLSQSDLREEVRREKTGEKAKKEFLDVRKELLFCLANKYSAIDPYWVHECEKCPKISICQEIVRIIEGSSLLREWQEKWK